jgi:bifunctional UDP-N-acetylglucosamine pyrophosphorylase/glucosamine-1-phosphate N-acetyltransferase
MSGSDFASVPAVLLAAGRGERMSSDLPKVCHEVLGVPLVRWVIRALRGAGIRRIVAVVGHRKDLVQQILQEECEFVDQGEPKGTGHAVLAAREILRGYEGPLLVLNGDVPLVAPGTLRALVLGLDKLSADAMVMTACVDAPTGYGRIVRDSQGRIERIVEQADAKMETMISEINGGAYGFRAPAVFETLSRVQPSSKGEYYLTDAVRLILERGGRVEAARVTNPAEAWGVNTRRDLVTVSNYLRWELLEAHMRNGVTIVDPSSVYIEDGVSIGRDTIVYPYTVLQRGVTIGARCKIGPFARLRGDTTLADEAEIGNFVEVKSSRLGRRSRAKHLSYLGDATLGSQVNIGAGTITANYDGRAKHPTTIEDEVQTGCHTVLIAPVRVGRGAKTGAGSVVLRGQDVAPGEVVAGVPARALRSKKAAKK